LSSPSSIYCPAYRWDPSYPQRERHTDRADRRWEQCLMRKWRTSRTFGRPVGFQTTTSTKIESDTRYKRLEQFIAECIACDRQNLASQTGGTTGAPKHGNWTANIGRRFSSSQIVWTCRVPRSVIAVHGPFRHIHGRLMVYITEHRGGRLFHRRSRPAQ